MGVNTTYTRLQTRVLAAGGVLLLGLLAGWGGHEIAANPRAGLATILPIVCLAPVIVRVVQGRFDPFEPIQIIALTYFILYGIRPAAELISGMKYFDNQYARSGFTGAAAISLVGVVSTYVGYALYFGRSAARRVPQAADRWDTERSVRFGIWVLAFCALLTAAFAATVGPSNLFHFYLGRTTSSFQTFLAVSGYVGLGPYLTIPASIIFIVAFARLRTVKTFVLFAFSFAAAVFVSVPQGDRTYVLALVLPLVVFPYIRANKRPSGVTTLIVVLAAILGLNVLLATRTVGKRQPILTEAIGAVTHIPHELSNFATGVDLAEFSVLELEYEAYAAKTNALTYTPGETILATLAYPLPRSIIGKNNKPQAAGQKVINRLFPPKNGQRASFNGAMFGDFYSDFGWVTIALYCFAVGIALRLMWEYFLLHKSSEGIQIVFAAALPMLVILVRNSITDAIARSLFMVGPLLLCLIVCSRPQMRRLAGWRVSQVSARPPEITASTTSQPPATTAGTRA
jgi:hypothetical protein